MSSSAFVQLFTGLSEAAGITAPQLQAHAPGSLAFHMRWRDITVDVLYDTHEEPEHAFALFHMGPLDAHQDAAAQLTGLLQANFLCLRANPPVFSRHPATGDAVLQCAFPLLRTTPETLLTLIEEGVTTALDWRQDRSGDAKELT